MGESTDSNIPESKGNEQFWWKILFGLLQDIKENEWEEFTERLLHENRFSSNHKIVKLIKNISQYVTYTIPEKTILYRARIYHDNPLEEFVAGFFRSAFSEETLHNTLFNHDMRKSKNFLLYALLSSLDRKNKKVEQFKQKYAAWQEEPFKGYNSKESNMPPKEKATEGRVNPEGIPYLYLSEYPETSIYEVRPTIGQYVSIAQFEVHRELKIFDFDHHFPEGLEDKEGKQDTWLFDYIGQQFSRPYTAKPLQYLPTQYLGEIIKQLGYDGLRFNSSLHQGGHNIVLFSNEKCEPVSSDYIRVENISISFSNPEMYQMDEIISDFDSISKEKTKALKNK